MKKILVVLAVLVATIAGASATWGRFDLWTAETKASKKRPLVMNTPLYVGPHLGSDAVINSSSNAVTRILGGVSASTDFAATATACQDSSGFTVTGAQVGDACIVRPPSAFAAIANANLTCRVSAANTVIVRMCASGTPGDPAASTYGVLVISNQ